jgi:hypothetical protein
MESAIINLVSGKTDKTYYFSHIEQNHEFNIHTIEDRTDSKNPNTLISLKAYTITENAYNAAQFLLSPKNKIMGISSLDSALNTTTIWLKRYIDELEKERKQKKLENLFHEIDLACKKLCFSNNFPSKFGNQWIELNFNASQIQKFAEPKYYIDNQLRSTLRLPITNEEVFDDSEFNEDNSVNFIPIFYYRSIDNSIQASYSNPQEYEEFEFTYIDYLDLTELNELEICDFTVILFPEDEVRNEICMKIGFDDDWEDYDAQFSNSYSTFNIYKKSIVWPKYSGF